MDYKLINNEDDIRTFMESFYYFHDSCLKELKYVSGGYLNPDGSMPSRCV
nr:hypothetical protein A5866_002015 [Enterococcus sp. 12C11_DIV0727]